MQWLSSWYASGLVKTEPGIYGARADARKQAASELRAEITRRRNLGLDIPAGARQLQSKAASGEPLAALLLELLSGRDGDRAGPSAEDDDDDDHGPWEEL